MSFIANAPLKPSYAPGWFLADDENCTRITVTVAANSEAAVTNADGTKYMPMGSVYAGGLLYEDVDLSEGDAPGSLVIAGHYWEDRIVGDDDDLTYTGLVSAGEYPTVTRPDEDEGDTGDTGETGGTTGET